MMGLIDEDYIDGRKTIDDNGKMYSKLQPDLSGALFLFLEKKKKAGTEGGLSCPNKNNNL